MIKPTAKITHLFHSGYAVETENYYLIFDYYQPRGTKGKDITEGIITAEYLKSKKNILVFVSHNHGDHFDPAILKWAKGNPDITYILSSDVETTTQELNSQVLSAYEKSSVGPVLINTFGSTDQGISFLVQVDGLSIFHAGDLNWWHWSGESLAEQATAKSAFHKEMEHLAQGTSNLNLDIDIAFFPVDRRMEEFYSLGAEFFANKFKPKLLVPMHFGTDFPATQVFAHRAKELSIPTIEITHRGQEFFF